MVRFYTEMEVDRLDSGIGYIRSNAFLPDLLDRLLDAIDELQDAPALIFDLRGNHGGFFEVRKALIDRLVDDPALFWTYTGRRGVERIHATPGEITYDRPVAVLVDVVSMSSAEEFSGALQALGRAVVVGEGTPGKDLVSEIIELPHGALMMHPVAQSAVADGTVLEAHGVVPDIPVVVNGSDLLAGVDPPLQAAIDHLEQEGS